MASDLAEFSEQIPDKTLDSLILSPEAKAHYSQENELKRLLIERETYKRAYETQRKSIDDFKTEWEKLMSTPVEIHKWTITYHDGFTKSYNRTLTLRDLVREKTYDTIYKSLKFNYKIGDEITYFKNYKFS